MDNGGCPGERTVDEVRPERTHWSDEWWETLCIEENNKPRNHAFYEKFFDEERLGKAGMERAGIFVVLDDDCDKRPGHCTRRKEGELGKHPRAERAYRALERRTA